MKKNYAREKLGEAIDYLRMADTALQELEPMLIHSQEEQTKNKILELFAEIRKGERTNLSEILDKLNSLGCFNNANEEDPLTALEISKDTIETFKKRQEAKDLIKEAITVGVLDAAGKERVYICVRDDNSDEGFYWVPELLDDAALDLVESGNVEMLRTAVEEARLAKNG